MQGKNTMCGKQNRLDPDDKILNTCLQRIKTGKQKQENETQYNRTRGGGTVTILL